jgi:hypothetical protein
MASPRSSETDAQRWLDDALSQVDPEPTAAATDALCQRIRGEAPAFQIALLKACVERLPALRAHAREDRQAYAIGCVLYGAACELYGDRLPYRERDVCDLLRTAHHDCGHGGDVYPPFDAAVEHVRRFGITGELIDAVRAYVERMKGISSARAGHLKRRAGLFFLLDSEIRKGEPRCWSHRVRTGLVKVHPDERVRWHGLFLDISLVEQPRMPKTWRKTSERFIGELGIDRVLTRFEEWWPDATQATWPLQSGGSQLLRHWVWMLDVIRDAAPTATARCDELALRLAALDWKPRERAKKVLVALADSLVQRPPDVAWSALQRLRAWSVDVKRSDWEPNRIADAVARFAGEHRLGPPIAATVARARNSLAQHAASPDDRSATKQVETTRTSVFGTIVDAVRRRLVRLTRR